MLRLKDQSSELLPVLILTDQVSDVFATGLEAALYDLLIDKRLEGIGQGDVHVAHAVRLCDGAGVDNPR